MSCSAAAALVRLAWLGWTQQVGPISGRNTNTRASLRVGRSFTSSWLMPREEANERSKESAVSGMRDSVIPILLFRGQ
jgi:hypothetical protein